MSPCFVQNRTRQRVFNSVCHWDLIGNINGCRLGIRINHELQTRQKSHIGDLFLLFLKEYSVREFSFNFKIFFKWFKTFHIFRLIQFIMFDRKDYPTYPLKLKKIWTFCKTGFFFCSRDISCFELCWYLIMSLCETQGSYCGLTLLNPRLHIKASVQGPSPYLP